MQPPTDQIVSSPLKVNPWRSFTEPVGIACLIIQQLSVRQPGFRRLTGLTFRFEDNSWKESVHFQNTHELITEADSKNDKRCPTYFPNEPICMTSS